MPYRRQNRHPLCRGGLLSMLRLFAAVSRCVAPRPRLQTSVAEHHDRLLHYKHSHGWFQRNGAAPTLFDVTRPLTVRALALSPSGVTRFTAREETVKFLPAHSTFGYSNTSRLHGEPLQTDLHRRSSYAPQVCWRSQARSAAVRSSAVQMPTRSHRPRVRSSRACLSRCDRCVV